MENQTKKNVWLFLSSVVIFCGLAVLGCCIYNGLYKISQGERVVTVRGLSEKEVKADKVKIPIGFFVSDNNLDRLADKVKKTNEIIVMFLKDNGIDDSEIRMGTPNVRENTYQGATVRYESNTTITVNTDKVEQALKIIGSFSDLLSQGVIVLQNEWNLKPEFIVSDLNTIKPKLITESMQNAKLAGEQFAKDAGSELGKMKTAYQGQISIEDVDESTPHIKKFRVVSTITYYIVD